MAANSINAAGTLFSQNKTQEYRRQNNSKEKEIVNKPNQEKEQNIKESTPAIVEISLKANEQALPSDVRQVENKLNVEDQPETINQMLNLETTNVPDAEAVIIAAKQQLLSMLIKSARATIASNYTSKSWLRLIESMKIALPISAMDPAKANLLDKAIGEMQRGLGGLEFVTPNQEESGFRKQLPSELDYIQKGSTNVPEAAATATPIAPAAPATAGITIVNVSV